MRVPRSEASEFGVMAVNENLKVKAFVEKPKDPPAMVGKPDTSLASMGIYVFDAEYLYKMLDREVNTPCILMTLVKMSCQNAWKKACFMRIHSAVLVWAETLKVKFTGVMWVRSIVSGKANIDLVSEHPQLDIYDQSWPIRGNPVQAYPSKFFYKKRMSNR